MAPTTSQSMSRKEELTLPTKLGSLESKAQEVKVNKKDQDQLLLKQGV